MGSVCPFWVGYLLLNPFRNFVENKNKLLKPYLKKGYKVLEVGPGMGFFTSYIAKFVGPESKVFAVDIQDKMLRKLSARLLKKKISNVELIKSKSDSLNIKKLEKSINLVVLFHVVHEFNNKELYFEEIKNALKENSKVLIKEPKAHVSESEVLDMIDICKKLGFKIISKSKDSMNIVLSN